AEGGGVVIDAQIAEVPPEVGVIHRALRLHVRIPLIAGHRRIVSPAAAELDEKSAVGGGF
ncbi:hypothetical protein CRG98_033738, partial [Punica granatum]